MTARSLLDSVADAFCYLCFAFGATAAGFAVGVWGLSALVPHVAAAPVPPPPRLSAELLAGATWRFEWAELRDGWISFNPDGTYCATHAPDEPEVILVGTWRVEGDRVVLEECRFDPDLGAVTAPQRREFTLATARFPTLAGRAPDGTRVVLADPQR